MSTGMFGRGATSGRDAPNPDEDLAKAGRTPSRATGPAGLAIVVLVAGNLGLPIDGSHLAVDALLVTIGYETARSIQRATRHRQWQPRYRNDMLTPLLPPLLVALALITPYWLLHAGFSVAGLEALLGAVTMSQNVMSIVLDARLPPIDNLWLISVVFQLGLLAPLLVRSGRRWLAAEQRAAALIGLSIGVMAVRIGFLIIDAAQPSAIAINTLTRFDGWLIGLAIGLFPAGALRRSTPLRLANVAVGVLVLLFIAGPAPEDEPVLSLGAMTATTVGLTALVLFSEFASSPRLSLANRVLDCRPLQWLGERALGIYIWHNLFTIGAEEVGPPPSGPLPVDTTADWPGVALFTTRMMLTLAAAGASYSYLELPTRMALGWGRPVPPEPLAPAPRRRHLVTRPLRSPRPPIPTDHRKNGSHVIQRRIGRPQPPEHRHTDGWPDPPPSFPSV